jgi:hypothetical protein
VRSLENTLRSTLRIVIHTPTHVLSVLLDTPVITSPFTHVQSCILCVEFVVELRIGVSSIIISSEVGRTR